MEGIKEQVFYGNLRPSIPSNKKKPSWPNELCILLNNCWSNNISKRPDMNIARIKLEMVIIPRMLRNLQRVSSIGSKRINNRTSKTKGASSITKKTEHEGYHQYSNKLDSGRLSPQQKYTTNKKQQQQEDTKQYSVAARTA